MAVFEGYVAPAARAAIAASRYNEYVLRVALFSTQRVADLLSLTLKVNACFRSTLKRLPLGDGASGEGRRHLRAHGPTRVRYYHRIRSALRTLSALSSAVCGGQRAPYGLLVVLCGCVRAAVALLGPLASPRWLLTGCCSTTTTTAARALALLWDPASS